MIIIKILAPNNDLFNQDYKLSYFSESLSQYEETTIKNDNNKFKRSKKIKNGLKKISKKNELSQEKIDKIREEKLELFSLFDNESYKNARNKFDKMLIKIKELSEVILFIILDSMMFYFKTFFSFLDDENIKFTSNKIENFFKKTLPKSVKKLMKNKKRLKTKISLRTEIWDCKNFIEN